MARTKDNKKRELILNTAKTLFAGNGFHNTGMAQITETTGLSVGSVYTYFKSKEDILEAIIQEGWDSLYQRLTEAFRTSETIEGRLELILDIFLPELLQDMDLISLVFFELAGTSGLQSKLDSLKELLGPLFEQLPATASMNDQDRSAAITVFFMGIIGAVRMTRTRQVNLTEEQILKFVKKSARASLFS